MLRIEHPVLLPEEMTALRAFPQFPSATLDATYNARSRSEALEAALDSLCRRAEAAVRKGARILILSDRKVSADRAPILPCSPWVPYVSISCAPACAHAWGW